MELIVRTTPPTSPSQSGHSGKSSGNGHKYEVPTSPSMSGSAWTGVGAAGGVAVDHAGIDVTDDSLINQHGRISNPTLSDGDVPVKSSSATLKKKLLIGGSFVVLAVVAVVLAIELMKHHGNDPVSANGVDTNQASGGGGPAALQVGSGGSSSSSSSTGMVATASGSGAGGGGGGGGSSSSALGSSSTSSGSGTTAGASTSTSPSSSSTTGPSSHSSSSTSGNTATAASSSTTQPASSSTGASSSTVPSSSSSATPSSSTGAPPSSSSSSSAAGSVSSSSSTAPVASSSTIASSSSSSGTPSSSAVSSSAASSSSTATPSSSAISSSSTTGAAASSSVASSSSAVPSSSSSTPSSSSSSTGSTVSSSSSSSATPASSSAAASSTVASSSSSPSSSSSSATPSSSAAISSSSHSSSSTGAGALSSSSSVSSSSSAAVSSSAAGSSSSTPSSSSTASPSSSSSAVSSSSSALSSSSSSGGGATAASSSTGCSSTAVGASSSAAPSSSTAAGIASSSSSTGASGPTLNYVRPGYTWYFNADPTATKNPLKFLYGMGITESGSPASSSLMSATVPMTTITAAGTTARAFYLSTLQPHTLPGLQAGSWYRFSMTAQFSTYAANYNCGTLKFLVYRSNSNTAAANHIESYNNVLNTTVKWQTWNVTNDRYPAPTGVIQSVIASFDIQCTNFTHTPQGRPYAVGEWVQYNSTFNMTTDVADTTVGVYWNPGLQSGKTTSTENINFANFTLTLLPNQNQRALDRPLQDSQSKLAQQPKQSTVPDLTDTSTCPHLWPGLVAWESIISPVNETQPVLELPDNTQILYGANSNPRSVWWQKIVIPVTSTLIFDDVPLVVHFENIMVLGAFRIGALNCRMQSIQQFFVHDPSLPAGNPTGSDPQCYYCQGILSANNGQKGIAAPKPNVAYPLTSSIIELHSYQYTPTWTRLAASVWPGDVVIYLQDANNWEVGQLIGLATSTWYDEVKPQNEQLTIAAISSDGKIIQLAKPAQFHHYAGPEYQSEVGLLTRRLTFSAYDVDGSASSSRIGGHIMTSGQLRASGVELTKMGQRNILGRYPLHWHNAGDSNKYVGQGGQVIQDCSFHTTYFRCLSIHATHNATVTRSVGFDVIAHCFFIEDGIEIQNTVSYNFAAAIHAILPMSQNGGTGWTNTYGPAGTWPIMPGTGQNGNIVPYGSGLAHASDAAPAPFYITNANNRFIGNAASGGFTGFSFVGVQQALGGVSYGKYPGYVPRNQPTLQFEGNTAHSSGYMWEEGGGCIYAGGDLQYNDTLIGSNGQPGDFWYSNGRIDHGPLFFNHTKVWLCMKGVSHWGQNILNAQPVANYWESHDTITSAAFFYGKIAHAYVNAHSGNPSYQQWGQHGFLSYDKISYLMLSDIEFVNFQTAPTTDFPVQWILTSMANFNNYVTQPLDSVSKFKFTNCDRTKIIWTADPYDKTNNYTIYSTPTRIEIAGAYVFNRNDYDGSLSSYGMNTFLANGQRGIKVQTSNLLQPNVLNTQDVSWPVGVPAVIGAANNLTSWWHSDNSCMLNEEWMVYICNMTHARRPIQIEWSTRRYIYPNTLEPTSASLFTLWDRFYTGKPDPDFGLRFGNLALFGPGITQPDRTQPVWNIYQITGLSGMGWWWNFDALGGSPNKFVTSLTSMYNNTYVIMAMPYPPGSNFTVEWRYGSEWWLSWTRVQPVPHYSNYSALVNTSVNQPGWTFDGSNLYVKMIAFPGDPTSTTTPIGPTELVLDDAVLPGGLVENRVIYFQWSVNCTGLTSRSICPVTSPVYPVVTQV